MARQDEFADAVVPGRDKSGFWPSRLLALAGCVLLALSTTGWWLSTRVLSADGFADVVAKSSQRAEVRDYIADQATLHLARSSNFVSAARPIVTEAVSSAIATDPVKAAVHDFVKRAHEQIMHVNGVGRVSINAQQAAVTVRSALQTINPSLSKKLPDNVLSATLTISQSDTVDVLLHISTWVRVLYIPVGLIGVGLLVWAVHRARDRIHALRAIGMTGAAMGALLMGFGAATPLVASAASTNAPGRGDAVAAFVDVLLGRLVGAGKVFVLVGLLLALAPGRDGGDLRSRLARVRRWVLDRRGAPRWQIVAGVALVALAALVLTMPTALFTSLLVAAGVVLMYIGIVWCLRGARLLTPGVATAPFHKRQLLGVAAAMVAGFAVTSTVAVAVVSANTEMPRANPAMDGCNGYIELCEQTLDRIVWPASHNAMASSAYDFFGAEHTISIPEQLAAGVRFLMIDAYYGYDEDGLVRTNLAGGISEANLRKERGQDAVEELDRLGALTGVADTSGHKQTVYFCHDFCELGAVKASEVFSGVKQFLEQNLTDVVVLYVEDYVKPRDLRAALQDAGLLDRVWTPKSRHAPLPTLGSMVTPDGNAREKKRRLVVMTEKHGWEYPWLLPTYGVSQETPYTFTSTSQFNCKPDRGTKSNPLLIVNHWLRPNGPPDPQAAAIVNSTKTLTARLQQCIAVRHRLPNVLSVDFTAVGDLYKTVNRFNAAVARVTGVTEYTDQVLKKLNDPSTLLDPKDALSVPRLPNISMKDARALLGPLADTLPKPADIAAAEAANPPAAADHPATSTTGK